jgi:hypothetical protein
MAGLTGSISPYTYVSAKAEYNRPALEISPGDLFVRARGWPSAAHIFYTFAATPFLRI